MSSLIRYKVDIKQAEQFGRQIVDDIGSGIVSGFKSVVLWGAGIVTSIAQGIASGIRNAPQWAVDVYRAIGNGIKNGLHDAVQWGKDIVTNIGNGLYDNIQTVVLFFTGLPGRISKDVTASGKSIAQANTNGVIGYWEEAKTAKTIGDAILKGIGIAVVGIIIAVATLTVSLGVAIVNGIINGFKQQAKLEAALGNLQSTIINYFKNAGSWLYNSGKSIVDGLANGIKGAVGDATSAVSNVSSSAVGKLKNLLGIHSPSTVFAELGKNVVQGFAQGITQTGRQAVAAMSGVVAGVVGTGNAGTSTTVGAELGDTTATSIINGLSSSSPTPAAAGGVQVHLHMDGIMTRSRADLRAIAKDMINSVNEELRARRLPLIAGGATAGRTSTS
jgi:hypothetical protein